MNKLILKSLITYMKQTNSLKNITIKMDTDETENLNILLSIKGIELII